MGKSSKPTIGYWHSMGLYMGQSCGPVDAVRTIEIGGEVAWAGSQTISGPISIYKPMLFGGEKKEGGIVGDLDVRMGEPTQLPSAYLQSQVPGPWPAARGLLTIVFNGVVGAMNPYVKLWKMKVSRWEKGWNTPVWQPTLAKIGEGMNPAHIIYEVMTDPVTSIGYPASTIDEASFLAAAQTLLAEDLGLCLKWSRSTSAADFIRIVCDHIGGQWAEDPLTGQITLRLFRADYDPATIPLIDETSIVKLESWEQTALDNAINEVTVVYRDCNTNKDGAVTYQNLAAVQAQGRVVNQKMQFPGWWNAEQAARIAAREVHVASSLLCRVKVKVKRTLWGIKRGDVYALSWKRKGVVRMPMRVLEVDEGTLTDSTMTLMLVQDAFGLPATTYIVPSTTSWTPVDYTPQPVAAQAIEEASYRDLSANMRAADLAQVAADAGYVVAYGARPSGASYNYTLTTRIGTAAFADVGTGDFSPTGLLSAAIGPTDTAIVLTGGRGLDLVKVGTEALIDAEKLRVDAIDAATGAVTIARGCVDTVPAAHALNARMWFTHTYFGADLTEYVLGETVDAKLLPHTKQGSLDPALATTISLTLAQRQWRPYPPGNLQINGVAYPATVTGTASPTPNPDPPPGYTALSVSGSLIDGFVGVPYFNLGNSGYASGDPWAVTGGYNPPRIYGAIASGVSVQSGRYSALYGTPLAAGTYAVSLTINADDGSPLTHTQSLTIAARPAYSVLNFGRRYLGMPVRMIDFSTAELLDLGGIASLQGFTAGSIYAEYNVTAVGAEAFVGVHAASLNGFYISDTGNPAGTIAYKIATPGMYGVAAQVVAGVLSLWVRDATGWIGGGDPATGTTPTVATTLDTSLSTDGKFRLAFAGKTGAIASVNMGNSAWTYVPPAGYAGLALDAFAVPAQWDSSTAVGCECYWDNGWPACTEMGLLTFNAATGAWDGMLSTIAKSAGRWQFELSGMSLDNHTLCGLATAGFAMSAGIGIGLTGATNSIGVSVGNSAATVVNTAFAGVHAQGSYASIATSVVLTFLCDFDTGQIRIKRNGLLLHTISGVPAGSWHIAAQVDAIRSVKLTPSALQYPDAAYGDWMTTP